MPKQLIYLSSCAIHPNGEGDPFMKMEQPWLVHHFDDVWMVAYQGTAQLTEHTDQGYSLQRPPMAGLCAWWKAIFSKDVWQEIRRLFRQKGFRPVDALKILLFAVRGEKMHLFTERLLKQYGTEDITLYSCWMSFDGYAAALSARKHPEVRFVVRGHAFDIDVERNAVNPYLMKQAIADEADGVYLISQTAMEQYSSYMQGRIPAEKLHVLAFGSAGSAPETILPAPFHQEGVLRIVSCAKVIPIKQVHVLVEALAQWEGAPVHWTHIGDGEDFDEVRKLAEELLDHKENVIVRWLGSLSAGEVLTLYENEPFDVFINTSRKEGVPVSIMEAMRCGVPAIAPRVGGLPELVTEETGWLYEPETGADGVCQGLNALAAQTPEQAQSRRAAAAARWQDQFQNASGLEKMLG